MSELKHITHIRLATIGDNFYLCVQPSEGFARLLPAHEWSHIIEDLPDETQTIILERLRDGYPGDLTELLAEVL